MRFYFPCVDLSYGRGKERVCVGLWDFFSLFEPLFYNSFFFFQKFMSLRDRMHGMV